MRISEKFYSIILLGLALIAMLILLLLSEGSSGGADSYVHYRIARYAWSYPYLFLDHWGKPVFTLIMAIPSMAGYKFAVFAHILFGCATAWLMFKCATILQIKNPWLVIPLVVFTPIYFYESFSVMTESFFSLLLVAALLLILKKKYLWAAVVASLFPLVRTEGTLLLVYLAGYLIMQKAWKALPLLATGILVYSAIGGITKGDLLWLYHEMPNTGAEELYGSGSLLHYIKSAPAYLGWPMITLVFLGSVFYLIKLIRKEWKVSLSHELGLFYFPFVLMLAAHSYLWWQGMAGTLGLLRVMCTVTPLLAIVALRGLTIVPGKVAGGIWQVLVLVLVIAMPFKLYSIPIPYTPEQQAVANATHYIKEHQLQDRRLFYFNPFASFMLQKDPFNSGSTVEHIPHKEAPGIGMEKGDIVIWDSHFANHEGEVSLSSMLHNPRLKPLYDTHILEITPDVTPGNNMDVWVFERADHDLKLELTHEAIAQLPADKLSKLDGQHEFSNICSTEVGRKHSEADKYLVKATYEWSKTKDVELALLVVVLWQGEDMKLYKSVPLDVNQGEGSAELDVNIPDETLKMDAYLWCKGDFNLKVKSISINELNYHY